MNAPRWLPFYRLRFFRMLAHVRENFNKFRPWFLHARFFLGHRIGTCEPINL
jgi:hypothetical protein